MGAIMLIEVTNRNVTLADGVREWIERRLRFALGRFSSRIRRVSVIFSDVNGGRGGCDKQCRLKIQLIAGDELVIEDIDPSVVAVVTNVAERAARSVSRVLERRREDRGHIEQSTNAPHPNKHASVSSSLR